MEEKKRRFGSYREWEAWYKQRQEWLRGQQKIIEAFFDEVRSAVAHIIAEGGGIGGRGKTHCGGTALYNDTEQEDLSCMRFVVIGYTRAQAPYIEPVISQFAYVINQAFRESGTFPPSEQGYTVRIPVEQ